MHQRLSKALRKLSYAAAANWTTSQLPEGQVVTPEQMKLLELDQDEKYVYGNGTRYLSAYTPKWYYKQLKKAAKRGIPLGVVLNG